MNVFPKYIMKLNRGTDRNEIKLFYSAKALYTDILDEWGNADMVVQSYILPKSKHASILRYEVGENMKIKAYTVSNPYDISEFPHLKHEDIVNNRKQTIDSEPTKGRMKFSKIKFR